MLESADVSVLSRSTDGIVAGVGDKPLKSACRVSPEMPEVEIENGRAEGEAARIRLALDAVNRAGLVLARLPITRGSSSGSAWWAFAHRSKS